MEKITSAEVINWAKEFLSNSEKALTADEVREQKKYAVLIQNPNDKILLSKLLDESSQIRDDRKLARRMKLLIEQYGVPAFFSSSDAFLIRLFTAFGYWFDFISVPIFKKRLRSDTSKVIIDAQPNVLNHHLDERHQQKIGQNVNLLGEVVLGDGEADHRYKGYLEALKDPGINYISIKISGIYAQINPLNYEKNKTDLCERLATIYRQSVDYPYRDADGNLSPKFVNLDMEEYKDTELTLDVFKTVLSYPEFKNYTAGIVVQAYLPDAWNFQTELLEFARKRVAEGGAPLKMRLVKGANLQMETVISSLRGWENPVLKSKVEVDANYLHILDRALEPDNARALHIGVASHNFFSLGYADLLSRKNNVSEFVTFEMLEGMANHLPRVMRSMQKQIILYTPVVKNEHFLNAVSYLVRRLDENTGKDNFLSYSFNLKYGSDQWHFLEQQFQEAFSLKDKMAAASFRTQDRRQPSKPVGDLDHFVNEPDTDFYLRSNRLWAESIRETWMKSSTTEPYQIPVQIGEQTMISAKKYPYYDRSQSEKVTVCEVSLSNLDQVKEIIGVAEKDASGWRKTTLDERNNILHQVALNLGDSRGNLIGCMAAITGKTFTEGDVEVSEATDFCRFYPISMKRFAELETISVTPKGIVLVIPPWNFPLAIPVGGVVAALSGGNSVILKPATVAFPVAWEFAKCFWDAGVPKDALQLVCADGREPVNYLTAHPAIKHIIMTGGTDTAFRLLENNPTCPLSAETGGKDAIILTASGDRDHAIQNIVTSAFSNAGQKCSACSLLVLEKQVYDDPEFKAKLVDAVTSLHTGSVWDGGNIVGPVITDKNEKLLYAIGHLEEGESWLVPPVFADEKHYMVKPCVKWGVKPDSYTFRTELFGPLLAVVCADDLHHAVALVNSSEYGLTSGLQSLDENEQSFWKEHIEAGNLYINRGITGAIVNRQPFGGMKRSAFGGGLKAGGRNYVSNFVNIREVETLQPAKGDIREFQQFLDEITEAEKPRFRVAVESYRRNREEEFSQEKDIHHIVGERNTFRYLPLKRMALRVQKNDTLSNILMIVVAATTVKTPLLISIDQDHPHLAVLQRIAGHYFSIVTQAEEQFLAEMDRYERVRTCSSDLSEAFYKKAADLGKYVAMAAPLVEGRVELLHYVKEQSIAFEYHRYGSITETMV
ncbi:proline dehydrogenase family protein [Microbacter margulisiae]|uniref:L-glutamate gamma-semialdehyde dehydrogenase n=1 Tax=Microbacter margulisiae TaxID=1350067 RepID=A0A7W5DNL7_9PORP|nr:bifunctional proline dehydrogenase/L-glutamate gamma-semialdehyde dehydrogenase [Microbacter margulisiae]MBB3186224.1 RHH-type proline utilization regulon transcriptional repressor/proline dehydrogenase/delta 1-pyrroline-5-carboxylate dehydrogenase [Microbacter margulisiae]